MGGTLPGTYANLRAIALGVVGGFVFAAANLPLPWLLGALTFNLAGSFVGLRLSVDTRLRNPALSVLGVAIGSSLTPDFITRAQDWWLTFVGIAAFVATATPLAVVYCRKVMGFDPISAIFAGAPGGLSEMIFTGAALGGDARRIALAHAARLVVILLLLPPAMKFFSGLELVAARPGFSPWSLPPPFDASVLLACALLGVVLGRLLKIPNPFLLGPLFLSAATHLLAITNATPPAWLLDIVQLVVGAYVGAQFAGTRVRDLARNLAMSSVLTVTLLGLASLFAWVLSRVAGLPLNAVLLAFVPGGIAEMCLIAILLHIDPIFVAAHHIFRVLLILLASPLIARKLRNKGRGVRGAAAPRRDSL